MAEKCHKEYWRYRLRLNSSAFIIDKTIFCINACVGRIYVDNDNRGVIIWQISANIADEDSLEAIRKKESTYAEPCIDANELGSHDWTWTSDTLINSFPGRIRAYKKDHRSRLYALFSVQALIRAVAFGG